MRTARTTAALRGALIATLTGVAVLFAPTPAGAHSVLADSTPEEGEVLTELPEAFSVTANEPVLDLGGQGVFLLQIRDATGAYYGDGCVEVVDATMSATPALGASGEYTMIWQVVSSDGHPVSGEVHFSWDAPADFEPSEGADQPPVCGGVVETEDDSAGGWIALGVAIALVVAGIAAAVIVAATRRRRAT
jgi:methionine-rich copper-binding protein CopC